MPHLICGPPELNGGVSDEAGQHGDTGRIDCGDRRAVCSGRPRRLRRSRILPPRLRGRYPRPGLQGSPTKLRERFYIHESDPVLEITVIGQTR